MHESATLKPFLRPENDLLKYPVGWQYSFLEYRRTCRNGVTGFLNAEDTDCLYHLARCADPGRPIVEIGSFKGMSTVHLAAGARVTSAGPVYAIDPFRKNTAGDDLTYSEYFSEFVATVHKCEMEEHVVALADFSHKLVDRFDDEEIDLLFIDGDHSYKGVKRDFELFFPKVRPGGLVAFHDSTYGPVAQFLGELAVERGEPVTQLTELITAIFKGKR